ncbi:hypothetical protein SMKI_08G1520 [Saccharomyces mikatae IFO 1815]|uniref:SET domain-containing protein n=1 Tax=Saccharomyces mikatae IFO 1815 TaxID=226126 RepID=A0AA35J0J7_SACMI|nr:uncharacterized protein SMKI_08G1520 [Saccharomyces mikatae IFO 1815]CAI4039485.1 hypothetical protein SMKI_08G1520 [Saccharomyces mikatae IFO 1815]
MEEVFRFYLNSRTVSFHKSLELKLSSVDEPKSGYGLFIEPSKFNSQELKNETITLLRISKLITFDINTILALLGDKEEFTSKEQFKRTNDKVKATLRDILAYPGFSRFLTETNLLIIYFMTFQAIHGSYEIPKGIRYYLENVLMSIDVETAMDSIENLAVNYGHYPQIFGLQESLNLFKDLFQDLLHINDIKHLYSAIISRCLEIPEIADTKSQEFCVHSTLVPILDFSNHENTQKNAFFDIDPSNNDVLLLLDTDAVRGRTEKSSEVFISYSPTEDLFSMLITYGFIPCFRGHAQFWTVSFDRSFLRDYNGSGINADLRIFYKWLRINPVVSLVKLENNGRVRWFINDTTPDFEMLLLPFIPSLNGSKSARWAYDSTCHLMFTKIHCLVNPETNEHAPVIAENYRSLIEERESNGDDLIDLPQLAWSLRYKETESGCIQQRHTNSEDAITLLQQEPQQKQDVAEAKLQFTSFFRSFLRYRKSKITKRSTNSKVARMLLKQELEIINNLTEAIDKNSDIFVSDLNVTLDVEPNRLPPLRFLDDCIEIPDNKVALDPICEDPVSYTPDKFTDFFQEEINQHSPFFQDD